VLTITDRMVVCIVVISLPFQEKEAPMKSARKHLALAALLAIPSITTHAQVYRWDNGQLCPGTHGKTPGPAVDFTAFNSPSSTLVFANLASTNLTSARFNGVWLNSARLTSANLTSALFNNVLLTSVKLTSANLTNAKFSGFFTWDANYTGADFTGAVIQGAELKRMTSQGFVPTQFYSTASYQNRNLTGLHLNEMNLAGWNFFSQNLTSATFTDSAISDSTLFAGAIISHTKFYYRSSPGLSASQLYSTASYQNRDLTGLGLGGINAAAWNFRSQNLTSATFLGSTLTSADFAGATINHAVFSNSTLPFAAAQLTSTASFASRDLRGVKLLATDAAGTDFSSFNLADAALESCNLTGANFTGANITRASFSGATGFTPAQLYSTTNYAAKDLSRIDLGKLNLTGADLSSMNLTSTNFTGATFSPATSLANSTVQNANFEFAVSKGLAPAHLYTTASYLSRNLTGLRMGRNNLTGWDFSSQDLTSASLSYATLSANFSRANLTSVSFLGSDLRNTNFTSANLTGADFSFTIMADANLTDANITGVKFISVNEQQLTQDQFYATGSYKSGLIANVDFGRSILDGWDFSGKVLWGSKFEGANVRYANLKLADLRGGTITSREYELPDSRGAILPGGTIYPLDLQAGEALRIRYHPIQPEFATYGSYAVNAFSTAARGSQIIVEPGVILTVPSPLLGQGTDLTIHDGGTARLVPAYNYLGPPSKPVLTLGELNLAPTASIYFGEESSLILDYVGPSPLASLIASLVAGQIQFATTTRYTKLPAYLAIAEAADVGITQYSYSNFFDPLTIDSTTIIAKLTYAGDANLDGQVDALDYERIDLAIGNTGVLGTAKGDLNYDGTVDALDYEQVDLNIGNGVGAPLSPIFIPEPTALAPVALLPLLTARRRR
jgi:uncharacterized protein YjbI with pentapeptide repeats